MYHFTNMFELKKHQLNISFCVHRMIYMNLMVTPNQKPVIYTQKVRERNLKITWNKVIKSQGREKKKRQPSSVVQRQPKGN